MSSESITDTIRNFIKTDLAKTPEHLDSLGLIKIINFLEERFSLKLKDEDISPEHFESIESISTLVDRTLHPPQVRS